MQFVLWLCNERMFFKKSLSTKCVDRVYRKRIFGNADVNTIMIDQKKKKKMSQCLRSFADINRFQRSCLM